MNFDKTNDTEKSSREEDSNEAPHQTSLGVRATRGMLWMTLSHGGSQILRFVANLILTRLLFEEAFGLMALVNIFVMGLTLFSDVGIGPSIIQNKRGDEPEFLNTAWTIQVFRGFVLWLLSCAGAVPFAMIYDQPILATIVPVSGSSAFILGLSSTKLFTLNRQLYVGRLAILELSSQFVGIVVMIGWAFVDQSVWALVAGVLVSNVLKTVLSHVALPGIRNRFQWNRDDARSLFRFGKWIFISTAGMFLANQSDRLIFAKLIPMTLLGVYHIGFTLANIPTQALNQLGYRIVFPLFSRVYEAKGNLPATFRKVRWPMLVFAGWAFSGLMAGGTTIVEILYDDRYLGAGWIVQMVALGCWFSLIEVVNGAAVLATGRSGWVAAATTTKFIFMLILIPIGHHFFEFPGAVAGMITADFLKMLVSYIGASQIELRGWKGELALGGVIVIATVSGWLASEGIKWVQGHIVLRALAVFIVVSLIWFPLCLQMYRRAKREGSPFKPVEEE